MSSAEQRTACAYQITAHQIPLPFLPEFPDDEPGLKQSAETIVKTTSERTSSSEAVVSDQKILRTTQYQIAVLDHVDELPPKQLDGCLLAPIHLLNEEMMIQALAENDLFVFDGQAICFYNRFAD